MTQLQSVTALRDAVDRLDGRPAQERVLRFFFDLPISNAWNLLNALRDEPTRLAAWSSEEDGCFVAGGVAWEQCFQGDGRFLEATAALGMLERARCDLESNTSDMALPFVLSGFAFRSQSDPSTDWEGWGDGRLWLPEWVVAEVDGVVRVVMNAFLGKKESPDRTIEDLISRMQWLYQLAGKSRELDPLNLVGLTEPTVAVQDAAKAAWGRRVCEAQSALEQGSVRKVVLARSERFSATDGSFDAVDTAFRMREQQKGCTVFFVRRRGGQAFVGATPEELIRRTGNDVATMSLAGTRRREDSENADAALGEELLASHKDRHEQQLVTQAIMEALFPVVEELVLSRVPEIAKLADVQHLRTRLVGRLREDVSVFELADRLHPSPAVGGLPRVEALEWIEENEGLDRGWYAGPIGWVRPGGDGLLVIAIRSVLVDSEEATAFVGCGLVENSDPHSEWEESQAKLRPAARGLALRPNNEG